MRDDLIAKKRESRTRHDDDHVKLIGLQPLHETDGFAMVIECALLDRWCDEWIAPLPTDESLHFLGAAAFQAENAESCKWHVSQHNRTVFSLELKRGLHVSEFTVFPLWIDLRHRCQPLRVTEVAGEGHATRSANGEPKDEKRHVVVREADAHYRQRSQYEQPRVGPSRSDVVTQPAHQHPNQNGDRDGSDYGVAYLGLRKMQFIPDDGHQRCDTEPSKEAEKQRDPRHVERAHRSAGKVCQTDPGCFMAKCHLSRFSLSWIQFKSAHTGRVVEHSGRLFASARL